MTTVNDLTFHGERAVLLSHRNGQPALWVISEEFDTYNSPVEGFTVNDEYLKLPINENEDLDYIVGAWKDAVEWEDGVRRRWPTAALPTRSHLCLSRAIRP